MPASDWNLAGLARKARRIALGVALAVGFLPPARAVLFFSTADPLHNTTAPAGAWADSGWQYQGKWASHLGTAIAPSYFITAKHIGGTVGGLFVFRGRAYPTLAVSNSPTSDLAIWRVCGVLPDFAPLYTGSDEPGQPLVVFGRGTQRGVPVWLEDADPTSLRGWRWGTSDGALRWGRNTVTAVVDGDASGGGTRIGELLSAAFDAGGGEDECTLSVGDSGGGVFLQENGAWKLAGINYSVDGPYNLAAAGAGFDAAVFDERGLFTGGEGDWQKVPLIPGAAAQPGAFYATRISAHRAWIDQVLAAELSADDALVAESSSSAAGPYLVEPAAEVDQALNEVRVPGTPDASRFYRLRACASLRIKSVRIEPSRVVLGYE